MNVSPQEFAELLARRLNAVSVVVGHDFRFGAKEPPLPGCWVMRAVSLGFGVEVVPAVKLGGERISSSGVRAALAASDFARAAPWLGRPWSMRGRVRAGSASGASSGSRPRICALERRASPVAGIFAVRVHGIGAAAAGPRWRASARARR